LSERTAAEDPAQRKADSLSTRTLVNQAIKFLAVGFITTAVTYFSFVGCLRLLGWNEYISNAVSYILGLVNSYLLNKVWTFSSKGFSAIEIGAFLLVFGISYAAQLGSFSMLRLAGFGPEITQILAMFPYTAVNFIGNKFLTFKRKIANCE
jgi:putative flippase GtrA